MSIKKILGTFLTMIGIAGLIIAAIQFINNSAGSHNIRTLISLLGPGLIFFLSGMGLNRTIRDKP